MEEGKVDGVSQDDVGNVWVARDDDNGGRGDGCR